MWAPPDARGEDPVSSRQIHRGFQLSGCQGFRGIARTPETVGLSGHSDALDPYLEIQGRRQQESQVEGSASGVSRSLLRAAGHQFSYHDSADETATTPACCLTEISNVQRWCHRCLLAVQALPWRVVLHPSPRNLWGDGIAPRVHHKSEKSLLRSGGRSTWMVPVHLWMFRKTWPQEVLVWPLLLDLPAGWLPKRDHFWPCRWLSFQRRWKMCWLDSNSGCHQTGVQVGWLGTYTFCAVWSFVGTTWGFLF